MKFKNFIGNEEVKKQISYFVESGRMPHAIIIEGEAGTGKRTLARDLAAALVCTADGGEKPCGVCPACKKAACASHPDIFEYSAKNAPRSFPVDIVRQVRKDVYVKPNEADYKIYILGNASSMGREAQNALLKTLEEPPLRTLLILTATQSGALLETVRSRCAAFRIYGVPPEDASSYISSVMPDADSALVEQSCRAWQGNIGKAIESIADGKMQSCITAAGEVCRSIAENNEYAVLCTMGAFEGDRDALRAVFSAVKSVLRDALVCSSGSENYISCESELASRMAASIESSRLMSMIESANKAELMLGRNVGGALLISSFAASVFGF